MNYYNEFDPFAAAWLRSLIAEKLIPQGDVDERSIRDVIPRDLAGYTQCHFFAGIGGWSYALQLAGWPANRPVWTGSCPCQPFSSAGNQKGKSDERHLWPVWFNLIRECRPPTIFGEQVSSAIAHGWLDDVYQGLEAEGYAVGSAVLPACSVGAPHKRDRLWFVANGDNQRCNRKPISIRERQKENIETNGPSHGNVAHSERQQTHQEQQRPAENERGRGSNDTGGCDLDCLESDAADTINTGLQGHGKLGEQSIQEMRQREERYPWESGVWIDCPDGKQRLVEPSIPLLAHGVPNRVGKLRGYGNAIVPQVAAKFIEASM